jgi:pilus assembly protein FimV
MFRKLASAILVAGALGSSQAGALGLGELTLHSSLNEPLDAEIKLLSVGDLGQEQVIVHLGNQDDFERAGVDRDYFLSNFKFEVELDGKGNGVIHIRTHNLVNEPYLNFIIEARWPAGKLLREYTALLDLPVYTERPAAQVNLGSSPGHAATATPRAQAPAAPSSSASSGATPTPYSGGDSYEIRRADTLWKVAQQVRPASDVSLQQTMVAIQQLNPDAFIHGNINLLREGAVLRLPSADQARQVSSGAARSEVASQSRGLRQKAETGGESADTLPVEREPQAESDGRLTLSSAAGGGEGAGAGGADAGQLKGKLNQSLENLDRAERDNADLKSRVTKMQDQVEKLQRLVQLKDEQMAALQKQAAANAASKPEPQAEAEVTAPAKTPSQAVTPPKAEVPAPAPTQPEQATPTAEAPTAEVHAATPAQPEQAPAAEPQTAPTAEATPPAAVAPKPVAPAPKPVVKPPVAAQPDLLETLLGNPLYLGLGGGLIALIILGLVLRQRAAQRDADASLVSPTYEEPAFDQSFDDVDEPFQEEAESEAVAESVYDEDDTIEQPAPSTTRSETGDAIGEADIYVAYGRYQHAIDLLKNAIASEPSRSDLRVKLLEVYLEAGDRDGFRSQFSALQALGDADATGRAKELLMSVDDGNAWIGDSSAFDPDATIPTSLASSSNSDRLDSDTTMERPAITDDDLADLDLGDELEEADTSWATNDEPDELPAVDTTAATTSLDDLDLDLGLDEDLGSSTETALEPLEDDELALNEDDLLADDTTLLLADDDDDDLDETLDLGSDTEFELATTELDAGGLGDNTLGGDSLDTLEEDAELTLDADLEPETVDTGFSKNLDDIDAEIGAFDAESLQAAADLDASDEEEFDFLSDSDEVATKLDLARAYIDMGDIDGARDILQEVLQEGEVHQKEEANKLLARIA